MLDHDQNKLEVFGPSGESLESSVFCRYDFMNAKYWSKKKGQQY